MTNAGNLLFGYRDTEESQQRCKAVKLPRSMFEKCFKTDVRLRRRCDVPRHRYDVPRRRCVHRRCVPRFLHCCVKDCRLWSGNQDVF